MGAIVQKNPFAKGNIWSNIEVTMGTKDWKMWLLPLEPPTRSYDGIEIDLVPSY